MEDLIWYTELCKTKKLKAEGKFFEKFSWPLIFFAQTKGPVSGFVGRIPLPSLDSIITRNL